MEGLRKRAFAIAALFILTGVLVFFTPQASFAAPKSEETLKTLAPKQMKGWTMLPPEDASDPKMKDVTYRMDEMTYTTLAPYGIVCRVFEKDGKRFDVVVISSNKKSSFHDPQVCFRAQGWTFESSTQKNIDTARGKVALTYVKMVDKNQRPFLGAYTYKGPLGFCSTPQSLAFTMLREQIFGRTDIEGAFYRFIPTYEGATEQELLDFVRIYLEEAEKTSKGFF